jgi:predicted cobalt transporter CbtA
MMEDIQVDPAAPTALEPPRRRRWSWLGVLIGGVGFVVVALVGLLGLTPRLPIEDSPEVTFARDMAVHHAQAMEMALVLRDRSTDAELRQFALDIMLTQQAQIGQMQG